MEGYLARKRAEKANGFVPELFRKGRILDIGCGSFPYFLSTTDFKEKYGVDPSLQITSNKDIKLFKQDVTKEKLPFADNYFDVVTMLAVFEHIEHKKLDFVLSEIRRVLKKDGVVIITTPAPWADIVLHFMGDIGLISDIEIHDHKHHYSKGTIEEVIKGVNFKKVKSGYFEGYMNMWFTSTK